MTYDAHPYAKMFPGLEGEDFEKLVADIRENGLREPITIYKDQILDGCNRNSACLRVGIKQEYVNFVGDDAAALAFVISKNLTRRHLTTEQRAMVAAKLATARQGERTDLGPNGPMSLEAAAENVKVSRKSAQRARKVLNSGDEVLIAAVESGDLPVSKAADIADLPAGEERETAMKKAREPKERKAKSSPSSIIPEDKPPIQPEEAQDEPSAEAGDNPTTPENEPSAPPENASDNEPVSIAADEEAETASDNSPSGQNVELDPSDLGDFDKIMDELSKTYSLAFIDAAFARWRAMAIAA